MDRELLGNVRFNALLKEALDLGIEDALECKCIKCLVEKLEDFYIALKLKNEMLLEKFITIRNNLRKLLQELQIIESLKCSNFFGMIDNDKKEIERNNDNDIYYSHSR